jgi:hypothetical protein
MAAGLTLGYLLFTATSRWSIYVVRYEIPLLVVWSAVIAIGLGRLHPWVGRVVVALLVVAALPQLLNNATRSIVHPTYDSSPYLSQYLVGPDGTIPPDVYDVESLTGTIATSSCQKAALGNWVLYEYPIWAALKHAGWPGVIEDLGVRNQTTSLMPRNYVPCAVIQQEAAGYEGPRDGMVQLQFGQYTLAIAPSDLGFRTPAYPGFAGLSPGLMAFPGGGWVRDAGDSVLMKSGSIYIMSQERRTVRLTMRYRGSTAPTLRRSGSRQSLPATVANSSITVTLPLTTGSNLILVNDADPKGLPVLGVDVGQA